MNQPDSALRIAVVLALGILAQTAAGQSTAERPKKYALWDFDEQGHTCRAKGRLQDKDYCVSHLMDQIIADGKAAIPVLISQLMETRPTKEPIYDYWALTTSGDIA